MSSGIIAISVWMIVTGIVDRPVHMAANKPFAALFDIGVSLAGMVALALAINEITP